MRSKRFFIFLFLSVIISSCAMQGSHRSKKRVLKLGNHKAWLERVNTTDPFFRKRKLNHPYKLNPDVLKEELVSLQYKGLALLSKKKRVFPDPVDDNIVTLIMRALERARPGELVKFSYNYKARKTTSGDFFITGNKLNWRFSEIEGKEYSRHGSRNWLDTWKLVLNNGQKYHGTSGLIGRSAVHNWIVTRLRTEKLFPDAKIVPYSAKRGEKAEFRGEKPSLTEETVKEGQTAGSDTALEKALIRLKRLRKRDLVTEKEYKDKKTELLRKSFR